MSDNASEADNGLVGDREGQGIANNNEQARREAGAANADAVKDVDVDADANAEGREQTGRRRGSFTSIILCTILLCGVF